ncbi:MAG TPA: PQQ-binding-like beta-propeller repeat protein, partial [Gemmataceae bacterium]|nr:PQQ-binding-like beta-propeller repeat protein [Gemmataceae bacterium]
MIRLIAVLLLAAGTAIADDWPQWMGPTRDDRWKETGILQKFPEGGPKKLWSAPIGGGYAGPAVVGNRVIVTDYEPTDDKPPPNNPGAASKRSGKERILCLDAKTGKELWKHEYDCPYQVSYAAGPRCTPTVQDGKVYALGAMGNLYALDAESGKVLWSKDFKTDYGAKTPIWGFTGHPLVYQNLVVCLVGGDSLLAAFDKDTGKEVWKALTTPGAGNAGYCPPTLIEAGGTRQLVIWHPKKLVSVNPEDGQRYWDVDLVPYAGMSIPAPRQHGDYLYCGGVGFAGVVLKLDKEKPAVTELWRGQQGKAEGLYPVNSTPIIDAGILYGVDTPGCLRAVELTTGKRLWATMLPVIGKDEDPEDRQRHNSATAFLVKNGDRYFIFGENGDLVIAKLSREKYEEVSRAKILEPTNDLAGPPGRKVIWSHPAFANKRMYARNDKEIVCVSLA